MNEDIVKGNWHELKGKVRKQWGNFTDNEVAQMKGSREELGGLLQKRYGYQKDRVEQEIDKFLKQNGLD
ncbi:MAG: CsbD family protein [Candidatus Berkiella sp.]